MCRCRVPPIRVYMVCAKKVFPQKILAIFLPRNKILHAHIVFISMQNIRILFSYLWLWRSYVIKRDHLLKFCISPQNTKNAISLQQFDRSPTKFSVITQNVSLKWSPCWASYTSAVNDIACICCGAAARLSPLSIDIFQPPAGPTAANLPHSARPDRHRIGTCNVRAVC